MTDSQWLAEEGSLEKESGAGGGGEGEKSGAGKERGGGGGGGGMESVHQRKHLWNRNIHLAAKTSPPHKTSVNGPLQPAEEVPTRGRMFPSGRTWDGLRAKSLNT